MKIAMFHELHEGGARKTVNEISIRLKKRHIVDLYIVTNAKITSEKRFYSNVYQYIFIEKNWRGKNWKRRLFKDTVELFLLYRLHAQIAKDISARSYDQIIIHPSQFTQSPFLLDQIKQFATYYCQEPLRIASEPTLFSKGESRISRNIYNILSRLIYTQIDKNNINSASKILANSKFTRQNVKNYYKKNAEVVYHGIDLSFYFPSNKNKAIDILFIGSKEMVDGYYFFQDIKKGLPRTARVAEIYSYEKRIDDKKLREYYQSAKIVLCLAYNEPFGLIPLEAMACGAVVLAVDEGGYKETIIQNKTGFLLPRDAKCFIKKINDILENKEIQKYISKNAVKEIKRTWSWDKRVITWFELLRSFNRLGQHMV